MRKKYYQITFLSPEGKELKWTIFSEDLFTIIDLLKVCLKDMMGGIRIRIDSMETTE